MRQLVPAALLLFCLLPVCAQDTSFYKPPVVTAPKVTAPPRIDGMVEPAEWAAAAPLSPFVALGGRAQPNSPTSVFVMYDDHSLYVAAILSQAKPAEGAAAPALKAEATERDGPVWEDDDFELFFDTEDQRKNYIHLAVNSRETQYDAMMQDKTADYRWKARVATLSDGWSVELELPFANDYPPAAGITWGLSVARHTSAGNELSAWDRKLKSFHEVGSFGSLIFGNEPLSVQLAALGGLWVGGNTAQLVIRNPLAQPVTGKLSVRVMGRDRYGHFYSSTKLSVPANGRQTQNVPYNVYEDGFSTVVFGLSDAEGNAIWRSSPYPIFTPEVAPQIARVEKSLGAALRLWMKLPDGQSKQTLRTDLDALTVQWRYLNAQYRDRAKMGKGELETLSGFAAKLQGEAEQLQRQIQATKQTGATPAFALAAAPSITHIFPDDHTLMPAERAAMDACRNETEALQVVVLPFR